MVAVLLVGFVVGAAFVPVPYVALRPGTARPVAEQVLVEGAPSYPPEQSIAYTTVRVGQSTLLEAFAGWLDDGVDVLPEEVVRGDRSPEENRRLNAELMDVSKLVSVTVALRHLGHDVTIRTHGAVVRGVAEATPAAERLEVGDAIVAVDGSPVDQPDEVGTLLQEGGPGTDHVLTVERPMGSGDAIEVVVTTIPAEDDPSRAIIGVFAEDRIVDFDFPFAVTIDSADVGGPSAGLAFSLAVIDVLTPGELTGGKRVAVTGTMSIDGAVGPVGGPAQKALTVRDAGYEVFLVPSAELDEVRAAIGDDLQVIPVDTLTEALDALDSLGGNAGTLTRAPARTS